MASLDDHSRRQKGFGAGVILPRPCTSSEHEKILLALPVRPATVSLSSLLPNDLDSVLGVRQPRPSEASQA